MARITTAILTDEATRHADAPLVVYIDNLQPHISASQLHEDEDCFVLGRMGQESVLFTTDEARELIRFLTAALKG